MKARIDATEKVMKRVRPLLALELQVEQSGLGARLLNLVKMRASQINGCAYCIDMHSKDARAAGESEQRLYGLDAWRDTPYYDERERAALAWTEALTRIAEDEVSDELFRGAQKQFSDDEIVDLTLAICAINAWNRIAKSMRMPAGSYRPHGKSAPVGVTGGGP